MSMAQFIQAPIPVQEWQFYEGEKLLAIAYIDQIPDGFSGIYFYFDPDARELSPGTWIILSMLERAKSLGLKYVYLGYYVKNCRSMEYKGNFDPSEILRTDGAWIPFLP
jgi:arginine-tRNA-protein transferase